MKRKITSAYLPLSYAKDTASTQRMETKKRQAVDGYNEDGGKRNEHGYMDMEQEAGQSRCGACEWRAGVLTALEDGGKDLYSKQSRASVEPGRDQAPRRVTWWSTAAQRARPG